MIPTILHDFFLQKGGAEQVVEQICSLYPHCSILTLSEDRSLSFDEKIVESKFGRFLRKKHHRLVPLFPIVVNSIKPKSSLIISSSASWLKNIRKPAFSLHICYCHTPMRYAWDLKDEYLSRENYILRPFISAFLSYLRRWDKKGSKNVDYFIANSNHVADRIKKFYGRDSKVIYPPIDTKFFTPGKSKKDYYFLASRLIEYKKVDLTIEAFNKSGKPLIIAGSGRDERRLKKMARPNIKFLGYVEGKRLKKLYQEAKAFIFPQLEDFGMTAVEAQACRTPVIAFGKGGALETVIDGKTGIFFNKQTPNSLINAIKRFESMKFDPKACRKNALRFDKEIFKKKIKSFVDEKYKDWKS